MTTKSLHLNNIEQKIFWLLVGLIGVMSIGYVYFVNSSIINVAIRDDYEEEISLVQTDITVLVEKYMALTETIDFNQALALGFKEVDSETNFVVRGAPPVTLSLVGNEI